MLRWDRGEITREDILSELEHAQQQVSSQHVFTPEDRRMYEDAEWNGERGCHEVIGSNYFFCWPPQPQDLVHTQQRLQWAQTVMVGTRELFRVHHDERAARDLRRAARNLRLALSDYRRVLRVRPRVRGCRKTTAPRRGFARHRRESTRRRTSSRAGPDDSSGDPEPAGLALPPTGRRQTPGEASLR
jgi:hypothetical protein